MTRSFSIVCWVRCLCALACFVASLAAWSAARAAEPDTVVVTAVDADVSAVDADGSLKVDAFSSASKIQLPDRPIRLAAIVLPESERLETAIDDTITLIREAFAPHPVEFERLDSEMLAQKIRDGTVDAFIASSGYYWRMTPYGATSVGALITPDQPDPNNTTAAVFLVRADNRRLRHILDLEDHKLAASFPTAFMTYRIGLAEIARMGRDLEQFFSEVRFTGGASQKEIVGMLDDGLTDAAIVNACWLESQPFEVRRRYRVLDEKTGHMACRHSTATYPGIIMAVTQGAPPGIAHIIARTILGKRNLSEKVRWAVATDMRRVDEAYKLLKIEQYAYLRDMTFSRWLIRYWEWPTIVMLFLIGLGIHSWRVSALVRRRTLRLTALMRHRDKARAEVQSLLESMENMHKLTVVGQLSSMIAHEISQPLAAIAYYCESQRDLLAAGKPNVKLLMKSCEGIELAVTRTRRIVEKVRSYNRGSAERSSAVELEPVVRRVLSTLNTSMLYRTNLDIACPRGLYVRADTLELELLLHNLLKNALEAACERPLPSLSLYAKGFSKTVVIHIENSGRPLSAEQVAQLSTPFFTSKDKGVGLGVTIAMALAEASGGGIEFAPRPSGGLVAVTTLVRAEPDREADASGKAASGDNAQISPTDPTDPHNKEQHA